MDQGELLPIVRAYVDHLKKSGVNVTGAVVHGPAARGIELGVGEIDVIVISPDFGQDRLAEGRTLLRAAWETDPRIVPVPLHPDTWAEADRTPFAHYAKESGIEVPLG